MEFKESLSSILEWAYTKGEITGRIQAARGKAAEEAARKETLLKSVQKDVEDLEATVKELRAEQDDLVKECEALKVERATLAALLEEAGVPVYTGYTDKEAE